MSVEVAVSCVAGRATLQQLGQQASCAAVAPAQASPSSPNSSPHQLPPLSAPLLLSLSCVSVNEVICHGIPDSRPIADGDIVNLDVTVYYKGFHSDMNETYLVGAVDAAGIKLVRVAYECLAAAIAMCKPGVFYRDLGTVITKVAHAAGFSVVKNYTGHGVGSLFHTAPNVPHYAKNKAQGIMRVGHVFTIEPVSVCSCALERHP